MSRAQKLDLIWKATPSDYKGIAGDRWGEHQGKRSIMVLREGVTTLVLLEDLTDAEINERLPKN